MKQKTKRIARAAFFTLAIMAMPLLIIGCQKEDLRTENPANQKIKAYEETFTLENFDDPYIKDNVTIDWDTYRSEETDSMTVYTFNTDLKEKQFIENGDQQFYTLYKLLVTEDDGKANLQLLKFFTDDKENLGQVDYFNTGNFSGTLYYYSLDGRNTKISVYEDGEVISEFEDKGHATITEQSKAPVAYCKECPEGSYVLVITEHYTDYYVSWNGGDFTYSYSVYMGTTSEWVWVPGTGGYGGSINPTSHSHYDYPHGPSVGTNNHVDEIIIDPTLDEDYPCQSQIIKDALASSSPITDLVRDIFNSTAKPSITIQAADLNNILLGGITPPPTTGNPLHYFITMNTERLDVSTDIDIACTAIHESIHALLFYFSQAGSFQSDNESYAQLVEDFTIYWAPNGGDQHEYMENLVGHIADALYDWASSSGYSPANFVEFNTNDIDNYDGLREYLGIIAWNGLTQTTTFQTLYPIGTLEYQNIIQLINSESLPYENAANPKGTPCNN
ncbi:MAG: hypothetical protein KDC90_07920 [Ignavibacteriae bacterium]|nr:hypothetical protein [Ignavibacteriota bacterium]